MANEPIALDSPKAIEFGFTSDKFYGYLWEHGDYIWISLIVSRQEGRGNVRQLLDAIASRGCGIIVPNPSSRMQKICRKWGMTDRLIHVSLAPERGERIQCLVSVTKGNYAHSR